MKTVLLLTDVNFWEKHSGNRIRIFNLIEYLSHHVNLTVVNTGPAPQNIEQALSKNFEAEFFVLEKTKYLSSNGYGRRLKTLLKGKQFDTVIIEYIHSSYFLNFLENDPKIILDAHDIISDRTAEFEKFNHGGELYEIKRDDEIEILNVYDYVMAICNPDYEKIKLIVGDDKALLCPHPVTAVKAEPREAVKNIAFIASSYLPNRDAIEWFVANCWPQISSAHNVQLNIYGTVTSAIKLPASAQITYKGVVANIDEAYREADIIINPVRFGAGLKIKNVEALANGIPLVTTPHGARGLEAGINHAFLVADDSSDMVTTIFSLIENPGLRHKLSNNAYHFIKNNFSPHQCFAPLLSAIN